MGMLGVPASERDKYERLLMRNDATADTNTCVYGRPGRSRRPMPFPAQAVSAALPPCRSAPGREAEALPERGLPHFAVSHLSRVGPAGIRDRRLRGSAG